MIVHEIFHSIQGESTRAGLPCTFVRLTGCPLRCGYCDTPHAFHEGSPMSVEQIEEVARFTFAEVELLCGFARTRADVATLHRDRAEALEEARDHLADEPQGATAHVVEDRRRPRFVANACQRLRAEP